MPRACSPFPPAATCASLCGAHSPPATMAPRHEQAALLGYASYADYALSDSMAKVPDAAMGLLMRVWHPALEQAAEEQAELQPVAAADGLQGGFAPWDWRFYAERVRLERYALDGGEVKRHLNPGRVRAAAFAPA